MTVDYCYCRHARQIHESPVSTLCRGDCSGRGHDLGDHTGRCTVNRCICDEFVGQR